MSALDYDFSKLNKDDTKHLFIISEYFKLAINKIRENRNLLEIKHKVNTEKTSRFKPDSESNLEYSYAARMHMRNRSSDREFPVDSVQLKMHEIEHDENIEGVKLHIGSYADEMARSMHSLAFTIGRDVFFRNGAYRPETEEGRALLAHELKHVSQTNEQLSEDNRTKNDLEKEAEKEELKEKYDPDPVVEINVHNETVKIRRSKLNKIQILAKEDMYRWAEEQEKNMTEEEYLKFLIEFKKEVEA